MENLGAMADSWCTGFRKITDHIVLDLHCIAQYSNEYREHMFSWRNKKNICLITPLIWSDIRSGLVKDENIINYCEQLCFESSFNPGPAEPGNALPFQIV